MPRPYRKRCLRGFRVFWPTAKGQSPIAIMPESAYSPDKRFIVGGSSVGDLKMWFEGYKTTGDFQSSRRTAKYGRKVRVRIAAEISFPEGDFRAQIITSHRIADGQNRHDGFFQGFQQIA